MGAMEAAAEAVPMRPRGALVRQARRRVEEAAEAEAVQAQAEQVAQEQMAQFMYGSGDL